MVSDFPVGDGKTTNLFLQCTLYIIYIFALIQKSDERFRPPGPSDANYQTILEQRNILSKLAMVLLLALLVFLMMLALLLLLALPLSWDFC